VLWQHLLAKATSIHAMSKDSDPALYPACEPFAHGFLPEMAGHQVYFEQCGHAQGLPIVFLHGGPGGGCNPQHRQLFNPRTTHAVLFDQRACGRSLAQSPLTANTTDDLIEDIERMRVQLGISAWLVVGGSWGGGLALAYARANPQACLGLVLRGVFLSRPSDLQWFFQDARQCLPDAWTALAEAMPQAHRDNLGSYLYHQIQTAPESTAVALAQAWQAWENALTQRNFTATAPASVSASAKDALLAKYRLQSHYLQNACFFPPDGLLPHLQGLRELPIHLLHGRLDWICRPESAWAVHHALPHSRLEWIDQAGHSLFESAMTPAVVRAIDAMVNQVQAT